MSLRRYWLMKSEPYVYSLDDLKRDKNQTTKWEGVRNYEARNFMRDRMQPGDGVLFYHSNVKPPHIAGTAVISSEAYPDLTQFNPESEYFDPKSSEDDPRWYLIDVTYVQSFNEPIGRDELKKITELKEMQLFKRMRLSVSEVTKKEWQIIHEMANAEPK